MDHGGGQSCPRHHRIQRGRGPSSFNGQNTWCCIPVPSLTRLSHGETSTRRLVCSLCHDLKDCEAFAACEGAGCWQWSLQLLKACEHVAENLHKQSPNWLREALGQAHLKPAAWLQGVISLANFRLLALKNILNPSAASLTPPTVASANRCSWFHVRQNPALQPKVLGTSSESGAKAFGKGVS